MTDDGGPITAAKLRLAVNNVKLAPVKARPEKHTRRRRHFAQVELAWLSNPDRQGAVAPWVRLYLLLQYATKRGERTVRLTTEMMAEIGISRQNKPRYLRQLEARGLVKVVRDGHRVSEVSLLPVV